MGGLRAQSQVRAVGADELEARHCFAGSKSASRGGRVKTAKVLYVPPRKHKHCDAFAPRIVARRSTRSRHPYCVTCFIAAQLHDGHTSYSSRIFARWTSHSSVPSFIAARLHDGHVNVSLNDDISCRELALHCASGEHHDNNVSRPRGSQKERLCDFPVCGALQPKPEPIESLSIASQIHFEDVQVPISFGDGGIVGVVCRGHDAGLGERRACDCRS